MNLTRALCLNARSLRGRRAVLLSAFSVLIAACATTVEPDLVVPTTGRYVETVFAPSTLTTYPDVVYSTRPNAGRQYTSQRTQQAEQAQPTLTLRMDIAVPPNATADARQPLLVLIHGGGFVAGDKSDFYPEMASYARAGYVVATINYRLTPGNGASDTIRTTAVRHAVEDAMNAIRFLRRNAARYGIDPNRVVSIGSSAGGGISLTLAIQPDDPRALSDAPGTSARVDGAVSTGATLQGESEAVLSLLSFEASDSPVLLYHAKETDSGTGATWTNSVLPTQRRIIDSGNACTVVAQPDMTHTVDLSIGNEYWPALRDFLYTRLRLASLR
jgi:poly(3-hydroxybutyrate) depolymerase